MNTKIRVLTVITMCIGMLLTVFSASIIGPSLTLFSSGDIQQTSTPTLKQTPILSPTSTLTEPYSYILSVSGSNYQMVDGATGQIVFQSPNSSRVFSDAVEDCPAGGRIDVESGVYSVITSWTLSNINSITLNFENGAELAAANNLNAPVLLLNNVNNCVISGVTIDGNAANQVVGSFPNQPDGVYIAGSNDEITNAVIYDCRVFGVDASIWTLPSGSITATHSGVINSKIYDCGWNGFIIGQSTDVDCYLVNSEIYGCSDVGATSYGIGSTITENYVHDLNGTTGGGGDAEWGIAIEGGCNDLITQNTVRNCSIGIEDSSCNNNTISQNTITSNSTSRPQYGIVLTKQYGTSCEYNSVLDNQVTGMYCNTTSYNGGIGIYLYGAGFNTICGNIISQCGSGGIYLDSASNNNTVSTNTVYDQLSGIHWGMTYGGSGIEISGNYNYISQNQAFDDRSGAARTQEYGISVDPGACNNVLIENHVYDNLYMQIYDTNVPENTMINNFG